MKVDIIIPVYNAYEYTVKCIDSVLKNTNKEDYNLVIINDKSTDTRIMDFLNELNEKKIDNIYTLQNKVNLGFVKTVNKGMLFSENDVVLLNSDTEVTQNWLKKIKKAAYLNEYISTVTPLTNNGTICSIPNYCKDNELPDKLTLEEYADIVEKTSLKLYPEIPTAVGFCMYIKRKSIEEVGIFDEESFGKGYGEENDFCCRALEKGYTHILCDDTFIYHKGSTSFLEEKEGYITKNSKILSSKYPYYNKMISEFVRTYSLKPIIDNINLQLTLRNNKKNVLILLHNDFVRGDNHTIGGTEYHVKDIIDNSKLVNYFVMYTKHKNICIQMFKDEEVIEFKFELNSIIRDFTISNLDYKSNLGKIIDYFAIDSIHVQHFKTHTFDVVDIAKERKIPIYLTIHDFYLVCPKINLLDYKNEYCKDNRCKEYCRICLRNQLGYNTDMLENWNKKIYTYLKQFTKIFSPSSSTKQIFENYYENLYGKLEFKIDVLEHGVEKKYNSKLEKEKNDKFKVAFLGSIATHKGNEIIYDIISNDSTNIEWHIFGNIEDNRLNLLEKNNFIKHGRYERNDIASLLINNNIDLICILSIWPETYSYTLSESIIAQIPTVVTDIGALGERVNKYDCGWTIPLNHGYKKTLEDIYSIYKNKDDYNEKYNNIKNIKLPIKSTVAKEYENIYLVCKKRTIISNFENNKYMLNVYKISNISKKLFSENDKLLLIDNLKQEVNGLNNHISNIENTIGWKMLNYLRDKHSYIGNIGKKLICLIRKFK